MRGVCYLCETICLGWVGKETDCKQLKILLWLIRHFERERKLPWLQRDVQGIMHFSC